MALAPAPELYVVGFSGTPVEGAAAINAPVFKLGDRYFSGDPDSPPASTYSLDEIKQFEERGLLTLTGRMWRRLRGGVVLYAHPSFVVSVQEGGYSLERLCATLEWDARAKIYLDYTPHEQALARLYEWACTLLRDAEKHLRTGDFARALDSAERAHFAATLDHREIDHGETEKRVFLAITMAMLGLGEGIAGIIRNVRADFSPEVASHIKGQAQRWWQNRQSMPTFRIGRLTKDMAHRRAA